MENKLKIGDIVELISGSTLMTIGDIDSYPPLAKCYYCADGIIRFEIIPLTALKKAELKKEQP